MELVEAKAKEKGTLKRKGFNSYSAQLQSSTGYGFL